MSVNAGYALFYRLELEHARVSGAAARDAAGDDYHVALLRKSQMLCALRGVIEHNVRRLEFIRHDGIHAPRKRKLSPRFLVISRSQGKYELRSSETGYEARRLTGERADRYQLCVKVYGKRACGV